jgi:asparagine synthase (glutamine-hydrolysing)
LQALGCRFQTESDTEVILHAYRTWGRACVSRFNGMWAFALLDRAAGEVFLSRDRFGIKPLYYVFDGARFAFASEIKGLLAGLPELRRSSAAMLHHFMPSGALDDGPETFFENVLALPAAHNMVLRLDAWSGAVERYWELDRTAFADRWMSPDPVGRLRELLDSSVKLHMRSDVPVGTCLSGGVDSSALVCLMSQQHPEPIHTFSGLYPDRDCDELPWVEAVRKHTGCVGHDIRPVPNGDLLDDLRSITWHQDEPSAGPGLYTQYHVMRRASQNVKVILDGQGGDELFAGYLPYLALRANDLFAQHGLSPQLQAWRLVASMAQHTNLATLSGVGRVAPMVRALTGLHRRLHRPAQGIGNEPPFFHPGLAARAAGHELRRERPVRLPDGLSDTLYWHTVQQSIPALLHYEDRNSMAFSIEARVPFLDYRVVEFALALDPSWKIRDTWTKWVLRKSVSDIVPPSVAWRRSKLGYPTPFARWLRDPREGDRIREVLFSRSFLDREVMTRESLDFYWNQHQAGVADRSWLLYRCVTLELWHQMYIDRFEPATAVAVPASSAVRTVELAA